MNKCKKCEVTLSDERIHLGYTECLDCSSTEKYASHTIYPHKTGGYIQPVSSEKSDELKRAIFFPSSSRYFFSLLKLIDSE